MNYMKPGFSLKGFTFAWISRTRFEWNSGPEESFLTTQCRTRNPKSKIKLAGRQKKRTTKPRLSSSHRMMEERQEAGTKPHIFH